MSEKFLSLHELEHGKLNLDDQAYCIRFGTPAHFAKLRKLIEADRDKIPGFSYWQCLNPGCLWKAKLNGETKEPVVCLKCNILAYKDGSWMKRMTAKEAQAFDKAEDERFSREIEQLGLMEFNRVNESRKQGGLEPVTRAEFDKGREAAWQTRLQVEGRLSKVKA